jgi:hypothetical protein
MNDVGSGPQPLVEEFLASHGGPFYELQLRLRLLLALPGSLSLDTAGGPSFLADPGAWAKFFIAIGAFILAEQQIEQGLQQTLRQLLQTPIIAPSLVPAASALARLRHSSCSVTNISSRSPPGPQARLLMAISSPLPDGGRSSSACRCSGFWRCAGYGATSSGRF